MRLRISVPERYSNTHLTSSRAHYFKTLIRIEVWGPSPDKHRWVFRTERKHLHPSKCAFFLSKWRSRTVACLFFGNGALYFMNICVARFKLTAQFAWTTFSVYDSCDAYNKPVTHLRMRNIYTAMITPIFWTMKAAGKNLQTNHLLKY